MSRLAYETPPARPASRHGERSSARRGPHYLHICNGLDARRDGGMVPSILGMTAALSRQEGRVEIVTATPSRLDAAAVAPGVRLQGPEVPIEQAVRSASVVHLHGLWQAQTRRGARAAAAARVPYLIATHGMADPWALRQKYWKKRLYLALIEAANLRRAACLHALSRPEIEHIRALSPGTPIGFVPNGVDLPAFDDLPDRSRLEAIHPQLRGKFVLLFFGRLHAKKGLDLLAESMCRVGPDHSDLHLLIAGTDDGEWEPLRARIDHSGLMERVTYLGHVSGEPAREVWGAADAFILPSYSEGFSMAILEALACRLPCLITTKCYFPELAAAGGAVVVEPDADDVSRGLRDLLERTPSERAALGQTGRALVERDYTWDRQAERLAAIYRWLAGGGPPPDCVLC